MDLKFGGIEQLCKTPTTCPRSPQRPTSFASETNRSRRTDLHHRHRCLFLASSLTSSWELAKLARSGSQPADFTKSGRSPR
jgi:hypothetical protein